MSRTPPVHVGQSVEVTVDRLTFGGAGLSRFEGFVIFVPFTVPGDFVEIKIKEVKKGYANAELLRVIKASDYRLSPPCPYFGACGACDWQNIKYRNQLEAKDNIVKEALKKHHLAASAVLPIVESPKVLRYRNRIQLHKEDAVIGYKKAKSDTIIDIDDCLLAEEVVAMKIPTLKRQFSEFSHKGKVRIDIRKTPEGSVVITNMNENDVELGFSQVNSEQNSNVISYITSKLTSLTLDFDGFIDLYAGSGNLTLPIHEQFSALKTIAVEANSDAVVLGKTLAQKKNLNITWHNMSVEEFFFSKKHNLKAPLVVIDPPRAGISPVVIKELVKLRPPLLVYMSCDPMTWSRDLFQFKKMAFENSRASYTIESVQPFDMFPQTHHIEIVSFILLS